MKRSEGLLSVCVVLTLVVLLAAGSAFAGKTTFVSTDFNMRNFDRTLWTLVSPANDGGIAMVNPGTPDAAARISVPAGSEHDIWTGGDKTVSIMQPATNTDFNLEVKYLNGLSGGTSAAYQAQGVMVAQDANNKMIFSFTTGTTPDSISAYIATFIGGYSSPSIKVLKKVGPLDTGPVWLRVSRVGNNWKQYYSFDGTTWDSTSGFTQAFTMSQIGLFADNAGARAGDFSSSADYFFNRDSVKYADDSQTLPADTQGPWVHGVRLMNYASNAAQIAWYTDEISDGVVEYGTTTAYGSNAFDLTMEYTHTALVANISASTLYNYRVGAGDAAGHVAYSGNATFTSDAIYNDLSSRSDGFSSSVLDATTWSVTDPVGDATISILGDQLSISVPGGVSHDFWTDGDNVPRVVQSVAAANVRDYTVRYNTGVTGTTSAYQFEGMLLQESGTQSMRVDFVNSNSGTNIYCASFYGLENPVTRFNVNIGGPGSAPLYMRVRQNGALWTVDYSFDGLAWTQAGTFWYFFYPTKVGITGGNSGATPSSFTALVEFFQGTRPAAPRLNSPANDAASMAIPVTLTWNPGIGATGYQLQVAKDSLFATIVTNDSALTNPTKVLSALQTDQLYFWRVRSRSTNGNSVYSEVWHFTTAVGIPGAPVLLAPLNNSVNVAVDQTLRWNATKSALTYYLQFGKDALFASPIVNDSTLTDTVYAVTGLDLNTQYFWRVRSTTAGGTGPFSATWRFTTVVPPPGQVTLSAPVQNALITRDSVRFVWFKAQPSVTKYWLEYAPDLAFQFAVIDSNITDTVKTVKQIPNNASYYWRMKAKNLSGWGPYSEVRIFRVEITSVNAEKGIPTEFTLAQNSPNPFNPVTRIEFGLPQSGNVTLEVFNSLGDRIATLVDENLEAGYHQVSFDGARFASGVYFYRLMANNVLLTKRMVLVK